MPEVILTPGDDVPIVPFWQSAKFPSKFYSINFLFSPNSKVNRAPECTFGVYCTNIIEWYDVINVGKDTAYLKTVQRHREQREKGNQLAKGAMRQTRNSEHPPSSPSPSAPIDGDVWHRCLRSDSSFPLSGGRMKIWRHMDQIEGKMRRRRRRRYSCCSIPYMDARGGVDSSHTLIYEY